MRRLFLAIIMILFSLTVAAQQVILGRVVERQSDNILIPMQGATIVWDSTNIVAISDASGSFSIRNVNLPAKLTVKYLGYKSETIEIVSAKDSVVFELIPEAKDIDEVTIVAKTRGIFSPSYAIPKSEVISFPGLCKMACCNLAESFENSAAVTVGYSDAVSGARQIKMLGLSGIYTQMLDENRPTMRGLSSPYGMSYTPGMWLQSIQVSKGIASVVNGTEALTGQINLEYRKPTDDTKLFLNLYSDQDLRTEVNVATSQKVAKGLSTVLLVHGSYDGMKHDENKDGFADLPTTKQINVANRWLYESEKGVQLRTGFKFLEEERNGGDMDFKSSQRGALASYGSQIKNKNFNGYIKAGIPLLYDEHGHGASNVSFIADYTYHKIYSYFGLKDYAGHQNTVLLNMMYQSNTEKPHSFIAGISSTMDFFSEFLFDGYTTGTLPSYTIVRELKNLSHNERKFGAFGEYTYNYDNMLALIVGARGDYDVRYGWMFTPRSHLKLNLTSDLILRGSAGKGYRTANLIADNIGVLGTGREIEIERNINKLEEGWTYGGSLTQYFKLFNDDQASISLDFFRTDLSNQVVADQEQTINTIIFYNTDKSYSNTWQADFSFEPFERFTFLTTFRYNDTKIKLRNIGEVERPLIDKFKALVNLQYATRFNKWTFDFTAQLNGRSRLPNQNGISTYAVYSSQYPMFYGQITRKFRKLDVYLGCENIGNYRQKNPIISFDDPFNNKFNSSLIWGPVMGRKFYAGLRLTI